MATPLKPWPLSDEEIVQRLMRRYPGLTREKIIEQARVWGWNLDLDEPPSPGPPKPSGRR